MPELIEHRFGSLHTLAKLEVIGKYLPAYTTALKNTRYALHYLDAFAGTGACHIRVGQARLMVPGSAAIAMACTPPFHRMVFIEQKKRHVDALTRLIRWSDRDIAILRQDANTALPECLAALDPHRDRALVFLDPYGMAVDWRTLECLSRSRLADVWYLFPLSGLYRQATMREADLTPDKVAAINRMMGTEAWREAMYGQPAQYSLLDADQDQVRVANVPQMLAWVKARLESLFPGVATPKLLYQTTRGGKPGAPLFALFFAVSNPSPAAVGLALKIARGVLR